MILVNFKEYESGLGHHGVELAEICKKITTDSGIQIIPVMSPLWIKEGAWLGHVDPIGIGAHTGFVSIKQAVTAGVTGVLLNHSEHSLPLQTIAKTVAKVKEAGLKALVCVKSKGQAERILKKMKPDFLAYEPKYLIGSKNSSIALERLKAFIDIVELAKSRNVKVLAGAGIKNKVDVQAVIKAGGSGILISSYVMQSTNFEQALLELVAGFEV